MLKRAFDALKRAMTLTTIVYVDGVPGTLLGWEKDAVLGQMAVVRIDPEGVIIRAPIDHVRYEPVHST